MQKHSILSRPVLPILRLILERKAGIAGKYRVICTEKR